ncbi:MAG TPA: hypothetical protein VFQ12_00470 [Thermoleophilaceae bacterium]|nr:hypothetical protein [Thermoleophilaceae bacterium]
MTAALSSEVARARADEIRTLERTVGLRPRERRFRRVAPVAAAPLVARRRRTV